MDQKSCWTEELLESKCQSECSGKLKGSGWRQRFFKQRFLRWFKEWMVYVDCDNVSGTEGDRGSS